ncbi:Hybrid signal transduction histidine kinase B [Madurella mycetomatis]|uniref:histidine kinase n=1 Tax=Madurella mycetomatis TaxID=100816 RepID=A0A175VPK3_9PEZI|nr:Hybrid signal transduction histidine kinase B [Madurella mycetomatis]
MFDLVNSVERSASATAGVEIETSERARQREIAAYLSAASYPPGLPVAFQKSPLLNTDPILNALTQLGALRLGVDRAFVSLIDRQYQYVVTEMTRFHSIAEMTCAPDDTIAIGVCKINNCDGVCPATMKAFMDETGEWVRTGPDVIANRTRYIINDFRTHPDYKDRPYVTGYPYFTSYLEVPLVSPLGYLLGSYCVVDNKHNNFDNDDIVGVMNEIASAIMVHLENVRIRQSRGRSEQLIQGLSSFIRHQPSTQQPESLQDIAPPEDMGKPSNPISPAMELAAESPGSLASNKPERSDDSTDTLPSHSTRCRPPPGITSFSLKSTQSAQSSSSLSSAPRDGGSETPPTTPRDELAESPIEQQPQAAANSSSPRISNGPSEISEPHGFISSVNIKTTFFKAATTIRRSMDMDGFMFLDAVPSSYVDRPDQQSFEMRRETRHKFVEGPSCAAIVKTVVGPGGEIATHSAQTQIPEVSLQRFIRTFPEGHVFTADELGPIDDSYGVGKSFQSHRPADHEGLALRHDILALFRVLPAARYVVFLPLWHFQRECWYAAALGWVEDPTRALSVNDIGLVSAFGNSVMAEVSRLETLAASRAKSDFVSSLSHELRSPLHGIMASSELLREAISNRSHLSTLDMLDSCATTLLDTFNNLLDHAIVTHTGGGRRSATSPISEIKDIDLGVLVEDVVEVVNIGYLPENVSQLQISSTHRRGANPMRLRTEHNLPGRPLLITMQIARYQWKLPVDVGTWKRIIMNVFGNALKYTSAGRIEVGLNIVKRTDRTGTASDYISFTVEDTGLGMSSDYLKYHLFTPFSQEDSNAPGMGLGLSIVQQLVSDLGGIVSIKSSLGVGTLVEVLVPLRDDTRESRLTSNRELENADKQQPLNDHLSGLGGRTLCFITPDAYAAMANTELHITEEARDWSSTVEKALRVNARTSLGMKVIVGAKDRPVPEADLYITDCNLFNGVAKQSHDNILQAWHARITPLVLLCSGSKTSSCLKRQIKQGSVVHLHHPIGPGKLASVFRVALDAGPDRDAIQTQIIAGACSTTLAESGDSPGRQGPAPAPPALPARDPEELALLPRPGTLGKRIKEPSPSETSAALEMLHTKTRHLLLVDDNPINMKLLTQVVRKLNHTFETANHGLEAVQLYKNSLRGREPRFDLVFMDISMPVMNGFEATREIRLMENEAGVSRCKIIALTGLSSDVNRNEASASGVDLFWTKPVKMNKIRELLDNEWQETDVGLQC